MDLSELTGPAAFVVIVLKIVFDFLEKRRQAVPSSAKDADTAHFNMVRDLWEQSNDRLSENIKAQNLLLEELLAKMDK